MEEKVNEASHLPVSFSPADWLFIGKDKKGTHVNSQIIKTNYQRIFYTFHTLAL